MPSLNSGLPCQNINGKRLRSSFIWPFEHSTTKNIKRTRANRGSSNGSIAKGCARFKTKINEPTNQKCEPETREKPRRTAEGEKPVICLPWRPEPLANGLSWRPMEPVPVICLARAHQDRPIKSGPSAGGVWLLKLPTRRGDLEGQPRRQTRDRSAHSSRGRAARSSL